MKIFTVVSATIATLSVTNIFAQEFEPAPYALTDGFAVIPVLSADVRYDDNIYNDENDTTNSTIFILKPSIKFGTDDGINRYGGSYELISGSYTNGSEDNFLDHKLALLAHTEYSAKQRTDFNIGFRNLHEDRGSGLTESNPNFIDTPLKYNELSARGYYQYGGMNALMRIGGGIAYADKKYQNFTEQSKYNDEASVKFFADFDYQLGNVTFLTFDIYTKELEYDYVRVNSDSRDNRDSRALIGTRWEGLGKTTGLVKVGYQYKTFQNDNRESFDGSTIDLGLTWQPVQHSSLTAHLNRAAEDTDTVGDYIEVIGASLAWQHGWTESFSSNLQYLYNNEDYIGADRTDNTHNFMVYLNYNVTRWFKVKAGYELSNKDSNADNISYDKNAVNVGIEVAL